jgi:biofilm PGA synthesis N-glycosyltransferase PgaC
MLILFLLSILLVTYTYIGYPLLLGIAALFASKPVKKGRITPLVSIFISAHNEEKVIEARVRNLLELDYPRDKMEIYVGSDGSTDETYRILKRLAEEGGIRYAVSFQRRGKPAMLNMMIKEAKGDIYVFTDARQRFDKTALLELVDNFADPSVGAVSGELIIEDKGVGTGRGMGMYWGYEKWLRRQESAIGSMLGATGAIYATRKEYFLFLPENVILDDIYTPFNAVTRGKRAVFDPAAKAYDTVSATTEREFTRKVRTLVGNFQIFGMFKEAFHPFRSPVAWQLFSHKFLRLIVPYALAAVFFSNLFLLFEGGFFVLALFLQVIFYAAALFGYMMEKSGGRVEGVVRLALVPYEFCAMNAAAVVALVAYLSGRFSVTWEKTA